MQFINGTTEIFGSIVSFYTTPMADRCGSRAQLQTNSRMSSVWLKSATALRYYYYYYMALHGHRPVGPSAPLHSSHIHIESDLCLCLHFGFVLSPLAGCVVVVKNPPKRKKKNTNTLKTCRAKSQVPRPSRPESTRGGNGVWLYVWLWVNDADSDSAMIQQPAHTVPRPPKIQYTTRKSFKVSMHTKHVASRCCRANRTDSVAKTIKIVIIVIDI